MSQLLSQLTSRRRASASRGSLPRESLLYQASDRVAADPVAAPLGALFLAYPLWWALGIQLLMWPLTAILCGMWLLRNRASLAIPRGFGLLMVFVSWALISGLLLEGLRYAFSWGLRTSLYICGLTIGFYAWNLIRHGFDYRRILVWLTWMWGYATVLSIPGLLFPNLGFSSPFGLFVQGMGFNDPYIHALTSPRFSDLDTLYLVPRPQPLFEYTNIWGAGVGILTPIAIYVAVTTKTRRTRLLMTFLLLLSVWPVVVSVNRGLWISIIVASAYFVARRAAVFDVRAIASAAVVVLGGLGAVLFTPLNSIVTARLTNGNNDTRANLYAAAIKLAAHSPFFGYGAPQSSADVADNNNVSVGTHGQFWTILVSQGYVGVLLFIVGLIVVWWHVRPLDARGPEVWLHATGPVVLAQMFVYDVIPLPLTVMLIACASIAASNREVVARLARTPVRAGPVPPRGNQRVPIRA